MEVNGISFVVLTALKNDAEKNQKQHLFPDSVPITLNKPQASMSTVFIGTISLGKHNSNENLFRITDSNTFRHVSA